jgi:hypothetical protein
MIYLKVVVQRSSANTGQLSPHSRYKGRASSVEPLEHQAGAATSVGTFSGETHTGHNDRGHAESVLSRKTVTIRTHDQTRSISALLRQQSAVQLVMYGSAVTELEGLLPLSQQRVHGPLPGILKFRPPPALHLDNCTRCRCTRINRKTAGSGFLCSPCKSYLPRSICDHNTSKIHVRTIADGANLSPSRADMSK